MGARMSTSSALLYASDVRVRGKAQDSSGTLQAAEMPDGSVSRCCARPGCTRRRARHAYKLCQMLGRGLCTPYHPLTLINASLLQNADEYYVGLTIRAAPIPNLIMGILAIYPP